MRVRVGRSLCAILFLVAFVAVLFVLTITGISDNAPGIIFFIYLIGMLCFLLLASGGVLKTSNDKILFWSATFLKIAYGLYRFPIAELSNPNLSNDAGGFWRTAVQYYDGNFSRVYTPFPYILNFEFHIFGKNVLCCCLTNIVLYMLMVLLVISVLNRFAIYGTGRFWSVLLSAFLVYGIQVTNNILREATYFILITASFFEYMMYLHTKKQTNIYFAILLLVPVLVLHIGYFPIAAVYIADIFLHEKIRAKKDMLNRLVIIIAFAAFVLFASQLNSMGYLTKGRGLVGLINKIVGANSDEVMGEAGSRYLAGLKISSILTFILYSPVKWFFYMFSPLPTNWRGLTDIAAFLLDGCVHLACLLMSVKCISRLKRLTDDGRRDLIIRLVRVGIWSVVFCGFVFGLGTSTAGTAIRHRDVMIGIEAILIGMAISVNKMILDDRG